MRMVIGEIYSPGLLKRSNMLSPQNTICYGDSTQLSILGGLNYQWYPNIGLSSDGSVVNTGPNSLLLIQCWYGQLWIY